MIFYLGDNVTKEVVDVATIKRRNKSKSWAYGYDSEFDLICISKDGTLGEIYRINGLNIGLPAVPQDYKIINYDKPKYEQKWKREPLPKGLDAETEHLPEYEDYILQEAERRRCGVFVYINGKPVYVTGTQYFFLQWVKLDEGYPTFRIIQNELMIYWEACKADHRSYGICYVKNRRFGWSSECNAELLCAGIQTENALCGIISKTGEDARKMFGRLVRSFKKLPSFFTPLWDGTSTPKKELNLTEPTTKRSTKGGPKKKEAEEGLDTEIKYYATALNSMDGEKVIRSAIDECFGKGTKILMADMTFRAIEDVSVGDYVMVEGGKKVRVAKRMFGVDDLYRVKQKYNEDYIVNSKHRLYLEQRCSVKSILDDGIKIMTPGEYMGLGKYKTRTTYGVRSKGLELEEKEVPVDAYLLGLWLGDGFHDDSVVLVNPKEDKEIGEFIAQYAEENDYSLSVRKTQSDNCKKYRFGRPERQKGLNWRWTTNVFRDMLKDNSLFENKHIPREYINNSRKIRLELLAGLIDSDGYLQQRNGSAMYSIGLSKKDLFDDIVILSRSLGFKTTTRHKKSNYDTDVWTMDIYGENLQDIPCKLPRKQVPENYKRQYACHINNLEIEPCGNGEYYGIQLEADNDDDRRLILGDFTISMNCGKYPKDVPFDSYWGIVKTSHRIGARIVGKSMVGSTMNSKENGGQAFKDVYDKSDPLVRNKNHQTPSGLYKLFIDAAFCIEGFFDEFGFSIVDDPEKPMRNEFGEIVEIGSVTYLQNEADGLKEDPEAYYEFLRQFPRTEEHAFRDSADECAFDIAKIYEQSDYNENELPPGTIQQGNFQWKDGIQDTEVEWVPNPKGRFLLTWHGMEEHRNQWDWVTEHGIRAKKPRAGYLGSLACDPYNRSNTVDGRGSKGSIHGQTKANMTGAPSEFFFLEYIDRPRTVELFFEDQIMAMVYFSMPTLIELANEKFLTVLKDRGYRWFSMNRPDKKWKDLSPTEKEFGGIPAQGKAIGDAQFYAVEAFVNNHLGVETRLVENQQNRKYGEMGQKMYFNRTISQWQHVDPEKRTKFDAYISSSLVLIANQVRKIATKTEKKKLTKVPLSMYDNSGNRSKRI